MVLAWGLGVETGADYLTQTSFKLPSQLSTAGLSGHHLPTSPIAVVAYEQEGLKAKGTL